MLVIDLRFATGRFHSTPWGRNVNEGVPEWPPSPYRIIRALFDAWHRKRSQWEPERIRPILEALTSEPPRFDLPAAAATHTRSYLSKNTKDLDAKALIFDAFVSLCPTAHVRAAWPNASLDPQSTADLNELLSTLNYLGRSESWVEARLMPAAVDCKWNCFPKAATAFGDTMESVRVACPMARAEYEANPYLPNSPRKSTKSMKPNAAPLLWLDALAYSTVDLLASGHSEPPAFKYVTYLRKAHCFDLEPTLRTVKGHQINGALYALESKVPPAVTSTIEIAEQVHVRLMGIHKRIAGGPDRVSPRFSGKSRGGEPLRGHRHVYILPQDRNRDGHLDHLLVICKSALDLEEQLALDRLNGLWQPDGKPEIRCTPLQWGTIEELLEPATRFTSATPFIPPLHHRPGRGDFADWLVRQVVIEAGNHGLPAPMRVTPVRKMENRGRNVAWLDFRRNRKGDSVRWEYGGFEIEFEQPVRGPFALGYGSHFGMGLFMPLNRT